jgi:hypothetical protein
MQLKLASLCLVAALFSAVNARSHRKFGIAASHRKFGIAAQGRKPRHVYTPGNGDEISAVVNDAENIVSLGDLSSAGGAISGIVRSALPGTLRKRDVHHYKKEPSTHSSYISSAVQEDTGRNLLDGASLSSIIHKKRDISK